MDKTTPKGSEGGDRLSDASPKELLQLPGKKVLDLILESPTPARLVQSLAEEDLFWIVQDIGPQDAIALLAVASNDQWQYLLDLELWNKDRLGIDAVNQWLGLLLRAAPERFFVWGLRENSDLIELNLFKNIEVRIKEQDESPSDFDDTFFTLDGTFYIRIRQKKYYEILKGFLERLAAHDIQAFRNVLMESIGVMPAEVEERIYRFRNARLAEKGFLPFEEAIGVYQSLAPERLQKKGREAHISVEEKGASRPTPLSTSLLIQDQHLFHLSLERIEDGTTLERLQIEFAGMCNQIISADSFIVRDKEDLASVVRKACGYLDMGLQRLDGSNPARAAQLVQEHPLNQIFRVGYGAGLELKWRAEKWLEKSWFTGQALDLAFWGDPWEGILEGLLRKRPLFYTSLSDGELYREFKDLSDIAYCQEALDQMEGMDYLLSLVLAHVPIADRTGYQPLRWMNLLLTSWARHHLGLPEDVEPIGEGQLKTFFRDLWKKGKKPYRIAANVKESFGDWLMGRTGLAAHELQDQVGNIMENLFKELESEYGSVSVKDLDPRYVRHFLVVP